MDKKSFWRYIPLEEWEAEFTDEFGKWWRGLNEAEQVDVRVEVNLLRRFGPALGRPYVDTVASSKYANMKELREVQSIEAGRIAYSSPSIRGGLPFC